MDRVLSFMEFEVVEYNYQFPSGVKNKAFLVTDNWNDYSFITLFHFFYFDNNGEEHKIGKIKIGFFDQTEDRASYEVMPKNFEKLNDNFFSLGQEIEFYENIREIDNAEFILESLNDVVLISSDTFETIKKENVFKISLLRGLSLYEIKEQYLRVFRGGNRLSNYHFKFKYQSPPLSPIEIAFQVKFSSKPRTNVHALIGRNGVGKTTLLNEMIYTIIDPEHKYGSYYNEEKESQPINDDYFNNVVSISFSAFDSISPREEQKDPSKGTCYFYLGLKRNNKTSTLSDLQNDCTENLIDCFHDDSKINLWKEAIKTLDSDINFSSMEVTQLYNQFKALSDNHQRRQDIIAPYKKSVSAFIQGMSSGHKIIFITINHLVSKVGERSLVLIDEPETHLHPPLLSAFIRALSDLLFERNGVAVIATHSPVVLQETPSSCVWKIYRKGSDIQTERPKIETFAENVGVLTREIFGLEVERSGFYQLLQKSVDNGLNYNEIIDEYNNSLGFEGRAILQAMIANRNSSQTND